jgi:heme-degrading monooxygenase HmoA
MLDFGPSASFIQEANGVILRIWSTRIDPTRIHDYERFALDISLPMFKAHSGFLGVLFARNGSTCKVITLWEGLESVAEFESSKLYRATVDRIIAAGFLRGAQSVDVYHTQGGELGSTLDSALRGA